MQRAWLFLLFSYSLLYPIKIVGGRVFTITSYVGVFIDFTSLAVGLMTTLLYVSVIDLIRLAWNFTFVHVTFFFHFLYL